jgi:protoporphyrinogen/coproporphyrinogen III oxidase
VIAIVGGGITGLAAAYELMERRVPFQLFEASGRLGGIIRTEHVDGFTIEAGPDSILAQKPAALALCEALGLRDRLITTNEPRTAFVLKRGRLHRLPSPSVLGIPTTARGIATYDLLSPAARARLAVEPLVRRRRNDGDESVASFFRRRFGGATVATVAEPLLGGIHAGDIEALSIRSLFPRFVDAEIQHGSVLRAFRSRQRPSTGGLFRSLMGGMEELVTTLERRLPQNSLHPNSPVQAIGRDGQRWQITTGSGTLAADAVVVACPAFVAADLIRPIDSRIAQLCDDVPYASSASIALAWPRSSIAHPLNGSGFVVARTTNRLRITACTWVSSKWNHRAPVGTALIRAFVGGSQDPSAVDLTDDELVELASKELTPILGIEERPTLSRVYRWRRAGAQHHVGQLERVSEIEQRLSSHRGLFVAGSGFRSVGIPDCVADGRAAAASACSSI